LKEGVEKEERSEDVVDGLRPATTWGPRGNIVSEASRQFPLFMSEAVIG